YNLFRLRQARAACLIALISLACAETVRAVSLTTYRERVHQSMIALDSLQAIDEDARNAERDEVVGKTVAEVRNLLPPTETIELNNDSMQVDNKWLHDALSHYEELLSSTAARRTAALTGITERLGALEQSLTELEAAQAQKSGAKTKDEEKAHLSNILRRDEYAKKPPEGDAAARLWRRFWNWVRSFFPNRPNIDPGRASMASTVAQIFIVALSAAIILYVLWKFAPRVFRGRGQRKKKQKREARVVLGEHLEPDQTSADLLAEAEALAREGNLRAAIRKGYIALLCELGDRKILGLAQHKTNRDYLRAVSQQPPLYQEMQAMTNSFENHWYGFVPASMDDWNAFRSRYQQALKQG
ncbi:MAG: DUF4129 domain-containing protein, partial [Acidobacteria bacterium]|nr:DUF4129 domain-containing protein [Acidobacteriota bacterium]